MSDHETLAAPRAAHPTPVLLHRTPEGERLLAEDMARVAPTASGLVEAFAAHEVAEITRVVGLSDPHLRAYLTALAAKRLLSEADVVQGVERRGRQATDAPPAAVLRAAPDALRLAARRLSGGLIG